MLVQLQGREVWYLQLNEAVSRRFRDALHEAPDMPKYSAQAHDPDLQFV